MSQTIEQDIKNYINDHKKDDFVDNRKPLDRIFVNRDLRLDCIKYIGFDMDHTLARFQSPQYEGMMYDHLVTHLIEAGYPKEIRDFKYDADFAVRGLYCDKETGHIIKTDAYRNILSCYFGRKRLEKHDIQKTYASLTIPSDDTDRYLHLRNVDQLCHACVFADLIEMFYNESYDSAKRPTISNIFDDVAEAYSAAHKERKKSILQDKEKYVCNERVETAKMLDKLNKSHMKVFLMTNSPYWFTDDLMSYLLDGQLEGYKSWKDYFEFVIVEACKPNFFKKGSEMRELNIENGNLLPGKVESLQRGHVYYGGSVKQFYEHTNIKHGNHVLYSGDNLTADVTGSNDYEAWRTFLIIPELERDLPVWIESRTLVRQLKSLYEMKAGLYASQPLDAKQSVDASEIKKLIKNAREELHKRFGRAFGSTLSSGLKNTEYAKTTMLAADIYAYSHVNLANYNTFHHFQATYPDMPHRIIDDIPEAKSK